MRLPSSIFAPFAAISLAALAACSSQGAASTAGTGAGTGTGGGGGSGGSPCAAADEHLDGGVCDTTLSWQSAGTITPARHHHVTFVAETKAGPFLYVAGGFTGTAFLTNVDRAAIQADGSLGAWQKQTALPTPGRAGHMIIYGAGHAIVMGGMAGSGNIADVVSAPIDDTGAVGTWAPQESLPIVRMHGSAALSGTTIYVVGGLGVDGSAIANVERATLGADGSVTGWEELDPLPAPRSHNALALDGGYLYALGGLDGDPAGAYTEHKDVIRAAIQSDGKLGAWTSIAMLPVSNDTASAAVHDGWLYLVGGIEGSSYVDHVRRAQLLPDHTLGPWESTPPLPKGRGHVHQTPVYGSHMYSVGGSIANLVAINAVFVGTFQ